MPNKKKQTIVTPKADYKTLPAVKASRKSWREFVKWYDSLPKGSKPTQWSRTISDYKNPDKKIYPRLQQMEFIFNDTEFADFKLQVTYKK